MMIASTPELFAILSQYNPWWVGVSLIFHYVAAGGVSRNRYLDGEPSWGPGLALEWSTAGRKKDAVPAGNRRVARARSARRASPVMARQLLN